MKKESRYSGDVWQCGFSDVRIEDRESFLRYRDYIAENPVKAGFVDAAEQYPFCFETLARKKAEERGAEAVRTTGPAEECRG